MVGVSANGGAEYSTETVTAIFNNLPRTSVLDITPVSGPNSGNTTVSVRGTNFAFSSDLACQFGVLRVRATFVSETMIWCTSPPSLANGAVFVEVTVNGVAFTNDQRAFTFTDPAYIADVSQVCGEITCDDFVTLSGVAFSNGISGSCRFTDEHDIGETFDVPAVVVSSNKMLCPIHALDFVSSETTFVVSVSMNGIDYVSNAVKSTLRRPGSTSIKNKAATCTSEATLSAAEFTGMTALLLHSDSYTSSHAAMTISPTLGPVSGGTVVTVSGVGLARWNGFVRCKFGSHISDVDAAIVATNTIQCRSPPTQHEGTVALTLLFNSLQSDAHPEVDAPTFAYVNLPRVSSIDPPASMPGMTIVLNGSGFVDTPTLACRFNGNMVDATYVSNSSLQCVVPPVFTATGDHETQRWLDVEVSSNAQDWSQSGSRIQILYPTSVTRITPASGANGTLIILSGFGFAQVPLLKCVFSFMNLVDDSIATLSTIGAIEGGDDSSVRCAVPHAPENIRLPVTVHVTVTSMEGQHLNEIGYVSFHYTDTTTDGRTDNETTSTPNTVSAENETSTGQAHASALISSVVPSTFPEETAVELTVLGSDFVQSNALRCVFTSSLSLGFEATTTPTFVQARWINRTALGCTCPPLFNTMLHPLLFVGVSNNGNESTPRSWFDLHLRQLIRVVGISPLSGPLGVATTVTVTTTPMMGAPFSSVLACRFGSIVVSAARVPGTYDRIRCAAPIYLDTLSTVHVSISEDGGRHYSKLAVGTVASDVAFSRFSSPTITAVAPLGGSTEGGTAVRISGTNFTNTSGAIYCRFGSVNTPISSATLTHITCISPPATLARVTSQVPLAVSMNGVTGDFVPISGVVWNYHRAAFVRSIHPARGSVRGGTTIAVSGDWFPSTTSLACRMFTSSSQHAVLVSAVWESPNRIYCVTPAWSAGPEVVTIEVSSNGNDTTSGGLAFTFFAHTAVTSLLPMAGVEGTTELVVVRGYGFTNLGGRVSCRFGSSSHGVYAQAVVINDTAVHCIAPPHRAGSVAVALLAGGTRGGHAVHSRHLFLFFTHPAVTSIKPNQASRVGGTPLLLTTDLNMTSLLSDINGAQLYCAFVNYANGERVRVRANLTTSSTVQCLTPLWSLRDGAARVFLIIAVPGHQRRSKDAALEKSAQFHFITRPIIARVYPNPAVAREGAMLRVVAPRDRVETHLYCVFVAKDAGAGEKGVVQSEALALSPLALSCALPALLPRVYSMWIGVSELVEERWDGVVPTDASSVTVTLAAQIMFISPAFGASSGGEIISVRGANFVFSTQARCRFGQTLTLATWIDNRTLLCTTPPHAPSSQVAFAIATNGVDWTSDSITFTYVMHPRIRSIRPNTGVTHGGTDVVITGDSFGPRTSSMYCHFGEAPPVLSVFVTERTIRCKSPSAAQGLVAVHVSSDGIPRQFHDSQSALFSSFTFYAAPHVFGLSPSGGTVRGGAAVVITGAGFRDSSTLCCRFGDTITRAEWKSSIQVLCISPMVRDASSIQISVSNNGADFSEEDVEFTTWPTAVVTSASPSHSPLSGGVLVVLRGEGFTANVSSCQFGSSIERVPAIVHSPFEAHCVSPPSLHPAVVELTLLTPSSSVVSTETSAVTFEFTLVDEVKHISGVASDNVLALVQPKITTATPAFAPSSGGGFVVVRGVDFVNTAALHCRFGTAASEAVYLSDIEVHCRIPRHYPGEVRLDLTLDGVHFTRSNTLFVFEDRPEVHTLEPQVGSSRGGSMITVRGAHFSAVSAQDGLLACRFGSTIVRALSHISDNELICIAPASSVAPPHVISVEVSNSNFTHHASANGAQFTYVASPILSMLSPATGPSVGGTVVMIRGYFGVDVSNMPAPICRFGSSHVAGVRTSAETITCITPPRSSGNATTGAVAFEVALDEQSFTLSMLVFTYTPTMTTSALWPTNGPAFSGSWIEITGGGFVESSSLMCRIGAIFVKAKWISFNKVKCRVPPGPPGMLPVAVGDEVDMRSTTQPGLKFLRILDASVSHVIPTRGLWTGQIPIFVRGVNFLNTTSLQCRFGTAVVRGVFISPRAVACIAPFVTSGKRVFVDISNNGIDFTASGIAYEYLEKCARGFYCSGLDMSPAPNGTVVSRSGSLNFSTCPVGSFQPQAGKSNCVACPIGYFCPESGLSRPVICAPGMLCTRLGLVVPDQTCPLGHYCGAGTKTANPMDFEQKLSMHGVDPTLEGFGEWDRMEPHQSASYPSWDHVVSEWLLNNQSGALTFITSSRTWELRNRSNYPLLDQSASGLTRSEHPPLVTTNAERPFPCPIGYFCGLGVSDPVPVSKNFSTPQKCFDGFFCPHGSSTAEGKGPCPTGFYCPTDTEAIPCPAAHYCAGVGNTRPKPCYPGTYNPVRAQSNCTLCPQGHICPNTSMAEPVICPAGFVCASRGLPVPVIECPAGHFCVEGTFIRDVESTDVSVAAARTSILDELVSGSNAPTYATIANPDTYLLPIKCPVGTFCLGGVAHNITFDWSAYDAEITNLQTDRHLQGALYDTFPSLEARGGVGAVAGPSGRRAPQTCTEGTYCRRGTTMTGGGDPSQVSATTSIGLSGSCFPGHYCPPGSEYPTKAPLGSSASNAGMMASTLCFTGTWAPLRGTRTCRDCPAGHSCTSFGTYVPQMCPAGTYRSRADSTTCRPCPAGTWSPYAGLLDRSQCEPCPPGRVCPSQRMTSMEKSVPCMSGFACGEATDSRTQFKIQCPAGYHCGSATPASEMYKNTCPAGHYCIRGTKTESAYQSKCRIGQFCPPGTTRFDGYGTSCPTGTTSYSGSASVMNCTAKETSVCDKKTGQSDRYYDAGYEWERLNDHPRAKLDDGWALHVSQVVMPINFEFSDPVWLNLTVEARAACPTKVVRGIYNDSFVDSHNHPASWSFGGVHHIAVAGRNFRDTKRLRCQWSPAEATHDAAIGRAVHGWEVTTPASFVSREYVLCPVPMWKQAWFNDSSATAPGRTELRIRVANAKHFSEGAAQLIVLHQETASLVNDPAVLALDGDLSLSKALADTSYMPAQFTKCYGAEAATLLVRPDADDLGWFALQGLDTATISVDFSAIPSQMVYGDHYRLAIIIRPSLCNNYHCDADRNEKVDETTKCSNSVPLSHWFNDLSTNKHELVKLRLYALEDILFRVEVHVMHGMFASAAMYFLRIATVSMRSANRANVTVGQVNLASRTLADWMGDEHGDPVMRVRETYHWSVFYSREFTEEVEAPFNLPPRWSDYSAGRVLTGYSTETDLVYEGPPKAYYNVLDKRVEINRGPTYWIAPDDTYIHDKYREVFDELEEDAEGEKGFTNQAETAFALPYMPYLSNCDGFDSYIPLFELFESDRCILPEERDGDEDIEGVPVPPLFPPDWWRRKYDSLPDLDDIRTVRPFSIFDIFNRDWDGEKFVDNKPHFTEPIADYCEVFLKCNYEEDLTTTEVVHRWFEAKSGFRLFQVYDTALSYSDWSKGAGLLKQLARMDEDAMINAIVDRDAAADHSPECEEGPGCFPRSIAITFEYYQQSRRVKRLVQITFEYDDFDQDTSRTDYEVTVLLKPLGYRELIVTFAFEEIVFLMLFVAIGAVTLIATVILYVIVRLLHRLKRAPEFRFMKFLKATVPPILVGCFMGLLPTLWSLFVIDVMLNGDGWVGYTGPHSRGAATNFLFKQGKKMLSSWGIVETAMPARPLTNGEEPWGLDIIPHSFSASEVDSENLPALRSGRVGLALLVTGIYHLYVGVHVFIPQRISKREQEIMLSRDKQAEKEETFTPTLWKRSNMLFCSIMCAVLSVIVIEFSFWQDFGTYFYFILVGYKVVEFLVEIAIERQLLETLLIAPVTCAFGLMIGITMTGADDFIDFLLGYALDYAIMVFERVWFGPYFGTAIGWLEGIATRVITFIRKMFRCKKRTSLEVQALIEEKGEEARTKRDVGGDDDGGGNEDTVEPILEFYQGYSMEALNLVYGPFTIFILMWFREETGVIVEYGIRQTDMAYYLLFALIIIGFQLCADTFLHNVMELTHGWKIYDYLVYSRYRFLQRETRWKGMEDSLDECIDEGLRTLDQMCFSSQYYLMVTIHVSGILLVMLATESMIRHSYNMFADPALLLIVPLILIILFLSKKIATKIAMKCNLWQLKHANTAWHSTISEEGDGSELPDFAELEAMRGASHEQYMMNQRIASETFRHKFIDYNRAWLVEQLPKILTPRTLRRSRPFLIAQFSKILGSVRSDISSDDSDDDEEDGHHFGPVVINSASTTIIRLWLAQARRRRTLLDAVKMVILQHRRAQCEKCLSRRQLEVHMVIDIDVLADKFADQQFRKLGSKTQKFDRVAWKLFFRHTQKFHTYCIPCLASEKQEEREKAKRKYAGTYHSGSSEEEEEDAIYRANAKRFKPVNLNSASTALMELWLEKAKAKISRNARRGGGGRRRRRRVVISDDESEDDDLGFKWARRPVRLSAASTGIAQRWLGFARTRLTGGEMATGHRERGRKPNMPRRHGREADRNRGKKRRATKSMRKK